MEPQTRFRSQPLLLTSRMHTAAALCDISSLKHFTLPYMAQFHSHALNAIENRLFWRPPTMMLTEMRSYNSDLLRRNPYSTVSCFKTRSDRPPFAITLFFPAMHCNSFLQRYAISQFIFFSSSRFWHRVRLLYVLFRSLKWKRNGAIVTNRMHPHKAFCWDHHTIRTLPTLEKHESHTNRIPNQIVMKGTQSLPKETNCLSNSETEICFHHSFIVSFVHVWYISQRR